MSDAVVIALIGAVAPCLLIVVTTIMQARVNKKQEKMLESMKSTGEASHVLQNSAALSQLKLTALSKRANAVLMQRIAELTNEAGDTAAADAADLDAKESEKLFDEHEKKQAQVDAITLEKGTPNAVT